MIGRSNIATPKPRQVDGVDQRLAQATLTNCAALAACPGWTEMLLPQIVGDIGALTKRILDDQSISADELRDLRNQRWALKRQLDRLQTAQQQARTILDNTPAVDSAPSVPHSDAPLPAYFAEALGVKPATPTPADVLKEAAAEFNPFPPSTP